MDVDGGGGSRERKTGSWMDVDGGSGSRERKTGSWMDVSTGAVEVSVNGDATEMLRRKEKGHDLLSCSENDDLHVVFDEWAEKYEIKYNSKKEREERFKIFRASKKLLDEHNSLNPGSTLMLNRYSDRHVRCGAGSRRVAIPSCFLKYAPVYFTETNKELSEESKEEKDGQDLLSCSENDQSLRVIFDEWAKENGKTYVTERDREERFQIFCASKKLVDEHNSLNLDSKLELDYHSDMQVQCGVVHVDDSWTSEEESEASKEAVDDLDHLSGDLHVLFDKWQEKYGIEYSSEKERKKRFEFFCRSKKRIDYNNSLRTGSRYALHRYSDRQIRSGGNGPIRKGSPLCIGGRLYKGGRRSCA